MVPVARWRRSVAIHLSASGGGRRSRSPRGAATASIVWGARPTWTGRIRRCWTGISLRLRDLQICIPGHRQLGPRFVYRSRNHGRQPGDWDRIGLDWIGLDWIGLGCLTHFTAPHRGPLLVPQCRRARRLIEELNKPVGLLDGNLRETAMLVENAKQITFGNFLGGQVS